MSLIILEIKMFRRIRRLLAKLRYLPNTSCGFITEAGMGSRILYEVRPAGLAGNRYVIFDVPRGVRVGTTYKTTKAASDFAAKLSTVTYRPVGY